MESSLAGKRALVTGAGRGIGKATAIKLYQCKATVIALDINQPLLDSLKIEYPDIQVVRGDVSDWDGIKAVVEGLGPIDLLVNNAGILQKEYVGEITEKCLNRILDINVKSLFNISQVVINGMKARNSGGAIVNLASVSADLPWPGMAAYSVSKAGVHMLTKSLALEVGKYNIRVNSVSPNVVNTDMGKIVFEGCDESMLEKSRDRCSLGRFSEPSNIADAIAFLLSDQASNIHGANLPVDAGMSST